MIFTCLKSVSTSSLPSDKSSKFYLKALHDLALPMLNMTTFPFIYSTILVSRCAFYHVFIQVFFGQVVCDVNNVFLSLESKSKTFFLLLHYNCFSDCLPYYMDIASISRPLSSVLHDLINHSLSLTY
jgi:hypothetical protein